MCLKITISVNFQLLENTEERYGMDKYYVKNKRLSKYLYSLGFEREYKYDEDKKIEYWLFDKTNTLQEALDFYFDMRKKNRE